LLLLLWLPAAKKPLLPHRLPLPWQHPLLPQLPLLKPLLALLPLPLLLLPALLLLLPQLLPSNRFSAITQKPPSGGFFYGFKFLFGKP
jgi:hypothetical protein